jgi:hypothetical protein
MLIKDVIDLKDSKFEKDINQILDKKEERQISLLELM